MALDQIKKIGMFQNTFMFHISIPSIPYMGANNLQFTIRSSTIPAYTRNKNLIRFLNQQYTLPGGKETDGEWSINSLISEDFSDFNKMVQWFYDVDTYAINTKIDSVKADAYVKMLGLNETVVTHRFQLKGIYALIIPEITDLNQENTDGFVALDFNLAFDSIDYDESNSLTF